MKMTSLFISVGLLVILLTGVIHAQIWPQPRSMHTSSGTTTFASNPRITKISNSIYEKAIERYLGYIFGEDKGVSGNVAQWDINIQSVDAPLGLYMDESYTLSVKYDRVELNATQIWGALRGLESLSQLVRKEGNSYVSNLVDVDDKPRFPWRGLLIDVARHYLSPKTLKRLVDGLAFNKMNVLHLHLVDAESFPMDVKEFPELSKKGAWHPDFRYSAETLKDLVNYAYDRGVRVVPEVDVPGHTYSWGKAFPQALANCTQLLQRTQNINNAALHLGRPITYDLVRGIIDQISEIFPDEYLHLGGDEVVSACWKEDTSIADYMRQKGMATFADFQGDFESRIEPLYRDKSKKMVAWQELSDLATTRWSMPKDSVIQVWKEAHDLPHYASKGYKIVHSGGWYLDKAIPDGRQDTPYLFLDNWKNMYTIDPETYLTPEQSNNVIGGEVCQWGEQIDELTIDARVWPRASAVAERLWSPKNVNDPSKAQARLIHHGCEVMTKRGIRSNPLRPDFCPYMWKNN